MQYDSKIHHRRSIRFKKYNYSQAGYYFITICTQNHRHLFGEIIDGKMKINSVGIVVQQNWEWLAAQYDYVKLGEFVIMPNHLHGIVILRGLDSGISTASRKTLGRLIGAFKTVSTKQINKNRQTPGKKLWQRNYWEHVIRDEQMYYKINQYIHDNPANWADDKLNGGSGNIVMEMQPIYNAPSWMV